jgi:myb proto-oncogene protein
MKGINPKIMRTKWSFEEDLILGLALKIYGNKKWSKIANHLSGRTDIQCRERYCNILDPSLEEVEWKETEDIKLITLYEKYGGKWSKIAREFGNRTDNTCWRRWKHLISLTNSINTGENAESTEVNNYIMNYDRKKGIIEKNLFKQDIMDEEEDFDNLSIDSEKSNTLKSSIITINNKSSVETGKSEELKLLKVKNTEIKIKNKVVKSNNKYTEALQKEMKKIIFVSKKCQKKCMIDNQLMGNDEIKEKIFNIVK